MDMLDHQRRADDIGARNATFKTAVQRIAPIVAHHEVAIRRHSVRQNLRPARKTRRETSPARPVSVRPDRVVLAQNAYR